MVQRKKEGPKFILIITLGFLFFGLMVLLINEPISPEITSSIVVIFGLLFMGIMGLNPPKINKKQ